MKNNLSIDRRLLENFSWPLFFSMLALCGFGLLNLYSISETSFAGSGLSWFQRQGGFLLLALGLLILSLFVDYQVLKKMIVPLYVVSLLLLIAVLIFGLNVKGATRWLDLKFIRFQPSESAKIVVVIALAYWLSSRNLIEGIGFRDLLIPGLIIGVPFLLIFAQPDLGTALHLGATCLPMFLVFRLRWHLFICVTLLLVGGVFVIGVIALSDSWDKLVDVGLLKPHQVERIVTFGDPTKDKAGNGWQVIQSLNAVGGGQLLGRGFMEGPQQKNGFLPEAETDFAFAAFAEEWGFVGSTVMIACFVLLLSSALQVAKRSRDSFGSLLALGMCSFLFWQIFINIGMVIGLLPVVGIPLPFVSYGGTSLLVTVLSVGLILNVGMRRYMFSEEHIKENPYVWKSDNPQPIESTTVPVRKLERDTPLNPEIHPIHRLPHVRPWAKYLKRGGRY